MCICTIFLPVAGEAVRWGGSWSLYNCCGWGVMLRLSCLAFSSIGRCCFLWAWERGILRVANGEGFSSWIGRPFLQLQHLQHPCCPYSRPYLSSTFSSYSLLLLLLLLFSSGVLQIVNLDIKKNVAACLLLWAWTLKWWILSGKYWILAASIKTWRDPFVNCVES